MKYGFRVTAAGRLLNPAAVFCADRQRYYTMLSNADRATDAALEDWCLYVLTGVRDELRKIDRLADYTYLKDSVLLPALKYGRQGQLITAPEEAVLTAAVRRGVVKAGDLAPVTPGLNSAQRTYQVKRLVDSGMLQQIKKGARQYTIRFSHNPLLRGVIHALTEEGCISPALARP